MKKECVAKFVGVVILLGFSLGVSAQAPTREHAVVMKAIACGR